MNNESERADDPKKRIYFFLRESTIAALRELAAAEGLGISAYLAPISLTGLPAQKTYAA